MQWCTSALRLAGNQVTLDDLPVLDYPTRSKSQPLIVLTPEATLWNRILAERYLGFFKQWTLTFVQSIVTFGSPYCVMRLLKSLEDDRGRTDDAWIWLIGIGVSSMCQTIIRYHLIWIQWSEMAIPIRAQLIMAIFQKALRMKDCKDQKSANSKAGRDKPEAINLISSDIISFSKFTAVNHVIPSSFIRFSFAVLFLVKLLGWQSTLVGMIVTVVCVPVHTIVIKQRLAAQKNLTAARDKKTKAVTEALHALRQIKFSAMETQWEERIDTFRQEEIKNLRWSITTSNIRSVWSVAAPFIVAAASICTYAYLERSISPSIIFPMIEVLPHLQGTLGALPLTFQDYFGARLNTSRMEGFLRRQEQKRTLRPSPSGIVSFQDASIAWPSDEVEDEVSQEKQVTLSHRFSLHGLNVEFPAGELSLVCGKTGSGKSLLLAAIIGEVDILDGRVYAPSMAEGHPVAFVSQTPWLKNATVQDNILFGHPYDEERYEKVLKACALQPDLAALPKGDKTKIGLRGVKLSGGQRSRVVFGRALYSSARLLVLDDIFSALDSHVSKEIFNAFTGELGKGRTRILVTHQMSLCLPEAKYIVHIRDNTVGYAGNTDSIREGEGIITPEVYIGPKSSTEDKSNGDTHDEIPKIRPAAKITKTLNARTDLKVYKSYFTAAGGLGFTLIYLLGLATRQLLSALTTLLLGRINSTRPEEVINQPEKTLSLIANVGNGLQQYLYLYLLSSLLAITLEYLFNLFTFSGSLRASKTLFREMTFRVIRMPLIWLDTTPIGEMLKRFTVDSRLVDDSALSIMSEFADCVVEMIIIASIG
jgi:ABC-type multidrug transport system fused ATPase/permease subunit